MKKLKALVFIALFMLGILTGCGKDKLEPGESLYKGDYYQLVLADGWSISDIPGSNYFQEIVNGNIRVSTVEITKNLEYDTIDGLVHLWIGMHAYVKEQKEIEIQDSKGQLTKVVVSWEQSAAEAEKGIPAGKNELHYFYHSDNNIFIDFYITDVDFGEGVLEELENILKTIKGVY